MSWNFENLLKGQVTQTLLQSVLEGVGYRVRRLGVEELLPEIRDKGGLPIRVSLPERLRSLPDFLVLDPESGAVHLTEVKFKRSISEDSLQSLMREVVERRQYWPETYTVVMVAHAPQERGLHQDHIRVVPPSIGEELEATDQTPWARWEGLPQLQQVYGRLFGSFDNQQIADSVTRPLRDLAKIQRPLTAEDV